MNWLNINFKKIIQILLWVTLPLAAIKTQERPPYDQWFDKPISYLVANSQNAIYFLFSSTSEFFTFYFDLIDTKNKNIILAKENAELKLMQSQMNDLYLENNRLKKLLSLQSQSPLSLLAAQIISLNAGGPTHTSFWINKGSKQGVKLGQAVLSNTTIVGSIIRTLEDHSQVLILSDRFSVIDALVERTRAKGIIEGIGNNQAIFKSFIQVTDLLPNDNLISSGLDNVFPKGIKIGSVKSIETDTETGLPKVIIELKFEPNQLEEVFISLSNSDQDHSFWSQTGEEPNDAL